MTQDNTGKLAEELRLLIDAAAERMQPWLQRVAEAGDGLAEEAESLRARDPVAREAEWRKLVLVPGAALSVVGAVAPFLG